MKEYDVAIIGSGINSLTAAALLAQKGKKVAVFERNNYIGGCIKTDEVTVPGFKHDIFSDFHPLFVSGPAYQQLKPALDKHQLKYKTSKYPTGVLLKDGRTAVLEQDQQQNITNFDKISPGDGQGYQGYMQVIMENMELSLGMLGSELWSWDGTMIAAKGMLGKGPEKMLSFMGHLLPPVRKELDIHFKSDLIHGLLAPWVLHAGMGPEDAGSGFMNKVVMATLEQVGNPVPEGGGAELPRCLSAIIEENGGELFTGAEVKKILTRDGKAAGVALQDEEVHARYVLANTTPNQLYEHLLNGQVEAKIHSQVKDYQYGRADMQIHLALDKLPAWPDERLKDTAIVHMTPGLNGLSKAVNEAERGLLPAEATIVVGQPTAADPSRAPEGKWIIWIQLQELPQKLQGDALNEIDVSRGWTEDVREAYADRIVERMDKQLPGLKESVLGRKVLSPADLEAANPNLVGGDPYSGKATIDQFLFWRPIPSLRGHKTPVKNLYQIGASTHPGPGLAGTSGYLVADEIG
jgi:phytoene dehydrogenase-like protein